MFKVYPPEYADPTRQRITNWVPPRVVSQINPKWEGTVIHLKHQPSVWYPAYDWNLTKFHSINTLVTNVDTTTDLLVRPRYAPVTLTIGGIVVIDSTDYRSFERPKLADWDVTRRIEYYLDGRTLITNVRFDRLEISSGSVLVEYTSITDGVRLRSKLRNNTNAESNITPEVESVSVNLQPGLHPHNQI
jgi:hypothetical protein